jgi:hypothetical protein
VLVEYKQRTSVEDYKQVINKVFELLIKVEKPLQMDSWHLLLETVFEKLYKIISQEILNGTKYLEDFKEIFIFTMKSIYVLILDNKIRPVDLIRKNYELLYNISKCQNRTLLDLLILNLNDNIAETIKLTDNPWIENVWEELIEYLTKLFEDYFPNEVR